MVIPWTEGALTLAFRFYTNRFHTSAMKLKKKKEKKERKKNKEKKNAFNDPVFGYIYDINTYFVQYFDQRDSFIRIQKVYQNMEVEI